MKMLIDWCYLVISAFDLLHTNLGYHGRDRTIQLMKIFFGQEWSKKLQTKLNSVTNV